MNIAIILSGGIGSRLASDIPKQYIEVVGKPIIAYSLETIAKAEFIDRYLIVAAEEWENFVLKQINELNIEGKFMGFAIPGENRQLSILSGLHMIKEKAQETELVLVMDAARPLLTEELVIQLFEGAKDHDGAMPVLPMKDTVYMSQDGLEISELLDRSKIFAGQAPEVFQFDKYLQANERLLPEEILRINGSSEPAILAGMNIAMIPGDERNFKITTQADLERFKRIIRETD